MSKETSFTAQNKNLGNWGEALAKTHLEAQGYVTVAQNWRHSRSGEIDLIVTAPEKKLLAFVEVKTRSSTTHGSALEAITPAKRTQIVRLAQHFLHQHPAYHHHDIRFDVIGITPVDPPQIEHIKNAFGA